MPDAFGLLALPLPVPASLSVVSPFGTTPPLVAVSGTPDTTVSTLRIDIVVGGVRGTATFRWSVDNGVTWQPTVPTAASVVLGTCGLAAAFAAGTYNADNLYLVDAPGYDAGDPSLSQLLKYLAAFLNDNALAAWQNVAPGLLVVQSFWPDKPPMSFNARNLPALFGYRNGEPSSGEWMGEDYQVSTSDISILWVMPWAQQETQKKRTGFCNAIGKLVNVAIERGRTPSFVISSQTNPASPDYDPLAATKGSLLSSVIGGWSIILKKTKPRQFVDTIPGGDSQTFEALEMSVEFKELMTYGLDRFVHLNGVDVKVNNVGGTLIVEGQQ